jgi:hypothetical protein
MTVGRATPDIKILIFFEMGTFSLNVKSENPIATMPENIGNAVNLSSVIALGNAKAKNAYVPINTKNGVRAKRRAGFVV